MVTVFRMRSSSESSPRNKAERSARFQAAVSCCQRRGLSPLTQEDDGPYPAASTTGGCPAALEPKAVCPRMRPAHAYESNIDGLRAVAVLGVLTFHAFPRLLAAGFLGVDVFFVISGYLITGILHREMTEGTFSLARFYERRARRI